MKNNEYWAKRFKALEERSNAEAQKCVAESMKLIDDAIIKLIIGTVTLAMIQWKLLLCTILTTGMVFLYTHFSLEM